MTYQIRSFIEDSASFAHIRRLAKDFRTRRAQRLAFDKVYGELQLLTNRELLEYGMHRSDFYDIARATVYRV